MKKWAAMERSSPETTDIVLSLLCARLMDTFTSSLREAAPDIHRLWMRASEHAAIELKGVIYRAVSRTTTSTTRSIRDTARK